MDAVVVGAGPNGLAAAVALARAGLSVVVLEAEDSAGGGTRSEELTLPGFVHDVCSTIHPLGAGSPFFSGLPLGDHGLIWAHPQAPLAHPLPDGSAGVLERSLDDTVEGLGTHDGRSWCRLFGPLVEHWRGLDTTLMAPMLRVPEHPVLLARFGLPGLLPASTLARRLFHGDAAQGLFAGVAAHGILDLRCLMTSSFALVLGTGAHAVGWPAARGGSQRIAEALISYLATLGGEVVTGHRVSSLADIPPSRVVLFDLTPRQIVAIAGDRLPPGYRRRLERYRYGPGSFKLDYALDGAVPWKAPGCTRAGTVHLGGSLREVAAAEHDVAQGRHPERPYVICVQSSLFDDSRAPKGKHTLWAYCHVPNGSTVNMSQAIEDQIERFAPGFRDRVLARHVMSPADLEAHNANDIGGDVAGGSQGGLQLIARPVLTPSPYVLPVEGMAAYLCSSSTPPGGGVHGMCGWWAAQAALKRL